MSRFEVPEADGIEQRQGLVDADEPSPAETGDLLEVPPEAPAADVYEQHQAVKPDDEEWPRD